MKSTIYYIHGWGSSPKGSTAQAIKHAFPDETFEAPHINYEDDPDKIKALIDKIGQRAKSDHDAIVVGSSAGGFWADYLGAVYGVKTVLINPSLKPSMNFKKYNLPTEYLDKYSKLEKMVAKHPRHHMTAFSGEKDDIVPTKHVTSRYPNPTILKDEGHRLSNLSPVIKRIKSLIGNFPEHL